MYPPFLVANLGAISVKPAMAFLTATHSTEGTSTVHLGEYEYEIIPDEKYEGLQKRITIKNQKRFLLK